MKKMQPDRELSIFEAEAVDQYFRMGRAVIAHEKAIEGLPKGYISRKKVGQVIRTVDVESIIKLSQKSYQIDFVVTEQERSGKVKGRTRMRGVLEIEFLTPAAEDMEKNPLGIYISNFDFTVVSAAR